MSATAQNVYSPANLLEQSKSAPYELGYYKLRFYVDDKGLLAKTDTGILGDFFYSPSGGTLRDSAMNIVLYSAKFDIYKGIGAASAE
ncbi:MAG: hypothetical protein JNL32_04285 [Candidatus Kapabacteria bacterium]|nr:hypothetical protein [Candidatus Kapabacteria bacterium]